jgi:hypothetical protein
LCDRGLDFEMNQKLFCQEELTDEQVFTACLLTARQYGEVVLPDEASGQGPGTPRQRGQETISVQGGYGTCFCSPGTNFIMSWRDRGTRLIGAANLSPVTKLGASTGPASGGGVQFVSEQEICQGLLSLN